MSDSKAKNLKKHRSVIGFVKPGKGAAPHGPIRNLLRLIGGEHHDRRIGPEDFAELQESQPVHARHPIVRDDDIKSPLFHLVQGFQTITRRVDVISSIFQR